MLWVTILDYCYWQFGTIVGALLGSVFRINTEGLSFVLTALFVALFLEQWLKENTHHSALLGLLGSLFMPARVRKRELHPARHARDSRRIDVFQKAAGKGG